MIVPISVFQKLGSLSTLLALSLSSALLSLQPFSLPRVTLSLSPTQSSFSLSGGYSSKLNSTIHIHERKSNDAEVESLREEYHERVATLERKVYALTKERDTLRREQNKKGDAAALLKEKDEIINQVMAEASGLWPSSTERKLLFDPVISFMGQTNEGSSVDSSQKAESSEHPPKVDKSSGESESPQKLSTVEAKEGVKTETLQHSSTEQMADKEETEVVKEETDDKHAATVEETETVVAEHEKSESESEK
ncbi:hypothetical protein L3X38_026686 [Prunus dulcis]|uniref:Golgin candidate 5 n=1 Tax=Prunus dulcis TaxID=3755 RepID=A0AAD4VLI7_PRUDU|nr:hypothetical protein L3X38_026686 [Prunus dulcis]